MNQTNKPEELKLSKAEREIVEDIRRVKYGRVVIYTQQGKPYRKEVVEQETIKPEDGGSAGQYSKPKGGTMIES